VRYETLAEEVKIGDHYLRLLLEDEKQQAKIHRPLEFFNDLYHRFLLTTKSAMKCMCLQAMAVVYNKCYEEIGYFNDTEFIVHMLNRVQMRQRALPVGGHSGLDHGGACAWPAVRRGLGARPSVAVPQQFASQQDQREAVYRCWRHPMPGGSHHLGPPAHEPGHNPIANHHDRGQQRADEPR
jgi:hypothetical protein